MRGEVWLAGARLGGAWRGLARCGKDYRGVAGSTPARRSDLAGRGAVWLGELVLGLARRGAVWSGKARQGFFIFQRFL